MQTSVCNSRRQYIPFAKLVFSCIKYLPTVLAVAGILEFHNLVQVKNVYPDFKGFYDKYIFF